MKKNLRLFLILYLAGFGAGVLYFGSQEIDATKLIFVRNLAQRNYEFLLEAYDI